MRTSVFSSGIARNVIMGMACVLFYVLGSIYIGFALLDQPGGLPFAMASVAFSGIGCVVLFMWRREFSWRMVGLGLWAVIVAVMGMLLFAAIR